MILWGKKLDIETGGIYLLNNEWNHHEQPIYNHRPVIVVKQLRDYAEVVCLDVIFKDSNRESQILLEYKAKDKKLISAISCDITQKVEYKYFKEKISNYK